jgi:hypothetical protein
LRARQFSTHIIIIIIISVIILIIIIIIIIIITFYAGHCATSRKVAGFFPDGVIESFHCHNPSGCAMALGSTQHLTEVSIRCISWGKRRPVREADNHHMPTVSKYGSL